MKEINKNRATVWASLGVIILFIVLPGLGITFQAWAGQEGLFRLLPAAWSIIAGGASFMYVVWPRPGMDQEQRIMIRKVVGALFIAGYGLPLGALLAVLWWKESLLYGLIAAGLTLLIGLGMLALIFRSGVKKPAI